LNIGADTVICELDGGIQITAGNHQSISWDNGSSNSSIQITEKGKYSVLVTDENGCENFDEITVKNFCCKIYHPNVISLSSTSGNEAFSIKETSCVISSKLAIYDRWGNLVFQSENGLDPWDGYYKGKPVELGVYTFIFIYKALDEDDRVFEDKVAGDVTVIR
jgi:gliding motility-associated-like protein